MLVPTASSTRPHHAPAAEFWRQATVGDLHCGVRHLPPMRLFAYAIAIVFYLWATLPLWRGQEFDQRIRRQYLLTGSLALAAHLLSLYVDAHAADGVHLHFFAALSWVSAGMVSTLLIVGSFRQIEGLGLVVLPIAIGACLLSALWGAPTGTGAALTDWRIGLHAILALTAFATLCVAALVAVMLGVQDRALRTRQLRPWLRGAPPLTQVENLLFQLIGVGFALLSLALFTGIMFVHDLFAQHLVHKTVLAIFAWAVFGTLLIGRWRFGWRGRRAIRLVFGGIVLLILAYLGSKFVLELILQRPV